MMRPIIAALFVALALLEVDTFMIDISKNKINTLDFHDKHRVSRETVPNTENEVGFIGDLELGKLENNQELYTNIRINNPSKNIESVTFYVDGPNGNITYFKVKNHPGSQAVICSENIIGLPRGSFNMRMSPNTTVSVTVSVA